MVHFRIDNFYDKFADELVPAGPSTAILDHFALYVSGTLASISLTWQACCQSGCLWMLPIILSPAKKKVTFSKSAFYSI